MPTMMGLRRSMRGGVRGQRLRRSLRCRSDPKTYNEKASKLVIRDKAVSVFRLYTSASRKAVLPVFEKRNASYLSDVYEARVLQDMITPMPCRTAALELRALGDEDGWARRVLIVGRTMCFHVRWRRSRNPDPSRTAAKYLATNISNSAIPSGVRWSTRSSRPGADAVLSNVVGDSIVASTASQNQGLSQDKIRSAPR